ncbi:MAG: hypothetical protein LUO96_04840, partial [Methanomicrobiales archaeon]|nr:hypothetical protein [Methanomicrobiales archaeon]
TRDTGNTCGTDPECFGHETQECVPGVCAWGPATCTPLSDIPCTGGTCDNGVCEEEPEGCTLTPGYWKTHTKYDVNEKTGKSKQDPTWNQILPEGEDTIFFLSGQSWYNVFLTEPSTENGGAYYTLAHQYMAAVLNTLQAEPASTTPEVDAAMAWAKAFFEANAPTEWQGLVDQSDITDNSEILDEYNNGLADGGPPHCP